jgi:uncharacterized membrane protein
MSGETLSRAADARLGVFSWLGGLALLAYPFAVYAALERVAPRAIGVALLGGVALRAAALAPAAACSYGRTLLGPALALGALAAATALTNESWLLLAAPALASLAFLASFARSLHRGPPVVERLARATNPDLTPSEVRYCRGVTWMWCGVFAANAACVLVLATRAPRAWWAGFAGLGIYAVLGFAFAAEYVVRRARFGRFEEHALDRALARVLRRSPRGSPR